MIVLRPVGIALVFGACLAQGAFAASAAGPSAIEIKTPAIQISISIDAKLKVYPGLEADLMAEASHFAAKWQVDAKQEYQTDKRPFQDGRGWFFELGYGFGSQVAGRYVSVIRHDFSYAGGAHPNNLINTILWDAKAKKRISVRRFFKETRDNGPTMSALAKLVRRAVAVQKLERWKEADPKDRRVKTISPDSFATTDEGILRGVQPKLLKIGPISLASSTTPGKSSGLTFHFSPYDVDAYAAGSYIVFVSWTAFREHLSAAGAAIFGGNPPQNDKDP